MLRLWQRFRAVASGAAPKRRRARARALDVERLEARQLLSGNNSSGPLANVTYHGGPLLKNVQVESVYFGRAWSADGGMRQQIQQVDGFLQYLTASPYFDLLSQYNVGRGTFLSHDVVAQDPPGGQTFDDSQVRAVLDGEIASGRLSTPTRNSLYVFLTAPGVTVTSNSQSSAYNFAGYHDAFTNRAGAAVYYAVVPYPTGTVSGLRLSEFQQTTIVLSHEVAEAVTDPDTRTGWFDDREGEIGDIANGQTGLLHGYTVQALWSQTAGRCVVPADTTVTTSTLHVTGTTARARAGRAFTSVVGFIAGAGAGATAADFTASLDWGDGTTSAGIITAGADGGFDITGTHTYTLAGAYPIAVTVADAGGALVGSALSQANVAAAPTTVTAGGRQVEATAGQAFTGVVATFTAVGTTATAANFTTTIDWGDGTTSAGTVTAGANGGFDVTGTHTYANSHWSGLSYPFGAVGTLGDQFAILTTTIFDIAASTTVTAQSLARIIPVPPTIVANGVNVQAADGSQFTGVVATFTSAGAAAAAANFTASLDWGDGTTSAGIIAPNARGGFDVRGSHTYSLAASRDFPWLRFGPGEDFGNGYYVIGVTVTNNQTGDRATSRSLATVTPAASPIVVTAPNLAATDGQAFTGVVATFTAAGAATAASFTAAIDWGDGTTSAGAVTANAQGGFDVSGTHTYANVANTGPVWGDDSGFGARAHRFAVGGAGFTLAVTVRNTTTGDVGTARAGVGVTPAPAPVLTTGTQFNAVMDTAFAGVVATFTAVGATATGADFTAAIDWGDGTTSEGTVTANGQGGFDVSGTHTCTAAGQGDSGSYWRHRHGWLAVFGDDSGSGAESFLVTTTLRRTSDGTTAMAVSLAAVAPAPPKLLTSGEDIGLTAGEAFDGLVANFSDAESAAASSFTATVDWGDGTTSAGGIAVTPGDGFVVTGTHAYAYGGSYVVYVRVTDAGGDGAVALSTATVADGAVPAALPAVGAALAGSAEYLGTLVTKDYQDYLGRTPGSAEVAYWVGVMRGGATHEQVQAGFVGSAEFYRHSGNTDQGWVGAMYQNLLGRAPDAGGLDFWVRKAVAGADRAAIAVGFATSAERESLIVQGDYQQYLGRAAGAAEVAAWVRAFGLGVRNEQIVAGFVGSQEYFRLHNANASDWLKGTYQSLFSRKPDPNGYNTWLTVLRPKPR